MLASCASLHAAKAWRRQDISLGGVSPSEIATCLMYIISTTDPNQLDGEFD